MMCHKQQALFGHRRAPRDLLEEGPYVRGFHGPAKTNDEDVIERSLLHLAIRRGVYLT